VNDAWKKFNGILREFIEKKKHKRINNRRPWVTQEIKNKRRVQNNA